MLFVIEGPSTPDELGRAFDAMVSFLFENEVTSISGLYLNGIVHSGDARLQVKLEDEVGQVNVQRRDEALRLDISELGTIQEGLRRTRDPAAYPKFWHRHWAKHSPVGARSPWQAFKEDGIAVLDTIKRHLNGNEVGRCSDIAITNWKQNMKSSEDVPGG